MNSENSKSQAYKLNKDLGKIPDEFKQKILELKQTAMIYGDNQSNEENSNLWAVCTNNFHDWKWKYKRNNNQVRIFTSLPHIDENTSGSNFCKSSIHININGFVNSIFMLAINYFISHFFGTILGWLSSFGIYLLSYRSLFSDGFIAIDTTSPVSSYRRVEYIPSSANIIYEELVSCSGIEKYDLMMKEQPYSIYNDKASHLTFKKLRFELPEYLPYKHIWSTRVWYVKQYCGVDDNGVCFILTKKAKAFHEWYTGDIEIGELDESIIIVPISEASSKVIFISNFDYGGQLPRLVKDSISVERLKHLNCIVSIVLLYL